MAVLHCIFLTLEKVGLKYRGNLPRYFYNIGPGGQCYETFSDRDLQIFVLASVCQTRLVKLTNEKHSSLLQKSVIYG
jgi:hypothetical protein